MSCSPTSSKASSRRCCQRSQRLADARSKARFSWIGRPSTSSTRVLSRSRFGRASRCSPRSDRSSSRSTTPSGSTLRPQVRWHSRSDVCAPSAYCCCSRGVSTSRGEGPALEEALDADAVERLRVGPLSIGAIHTLLQRRLGRPFARPTLRRLHEISGGNPFYALELARELGSAGATVDSSEPFPVPETLERLVGARLAGLDGATREALLLIAAHGRPSPALLGAAGISPNALEPAFAAQVVELSTDEIRFTHPLLASVLYQEASDEERRGAHGRLAAVVDDPVERARHLALASDGPDEDVAAMLGGGRKAAAAPRCERRRGRARRACAPPHAARTPPRIGIAARSQRPAPTSTRVMLAVLVRSRSSYVPGSRRAARAEALVLLSDIEAESGRTGALDRAAAGGARGGRRAADAARRRSTFGSAALLGSRRAKAAGDRHAAAALELAEAVGDDSLRAWALSAVAFGVSGRAFRAGCLRSSRPFSSQRLPATRASGSTSTFMAVNCFVWAYQLDRARTLLAGHRP